MRYRVTIICLASLVAMSVFFFGCQQDAVTESENSAVREVLDSYFESAKNKDVEQLKALFSDDPNLLIIGPYAEERFIGWEVYEKYVEKFFSDRAFKFINYDIKELKIKFSSAGNMACYSAVLDEEYEWQGQTFSTKKMRWSGVLRKTDDMWKFVQMHASIPRPGEHEMAVATKAIGQANIKFAEAVRNRDAQALTDLYTGDAILMPPSSEPLNGVESIRAAWSGMFDMGLKEITLTSESIMDAGDHFCEIGRYQLTMEQSGGVVISDNGKYLVMWKPIADDDYKLHIDIWNSNLPAK